MKTRRNKAYYIAFGEWLGFFQTHFNIKLDNTARHFQVGGKHVFLPRDWSEHYVFSSIEARGVYVTEPCSSTYYPDSPQKLQRRFALRQMSMQDSCSAKLLSFFHLKNFWYDDMFSFSAIVDEKDVSLLVYALLAVKSFVENPSAPVQEVTFSKRGRTSVRLSLAGYKNTEGVFSPFESWCSKLCLSSAD